MFPIARKMYKLR